jgi:hypothetical protein
MLARMLITSVAHATRTVAPDSFSSSALITQEPRAAVAHAQLALLSAATAFAAGARGLEATDLSVPDWRPRYDEAVKSLDTAWEPSWRAVREARVGVAALASDPLAAAALKELDAVIQHTLRGFDAIGRTFMALPHPLTPEFAKLALVRTASNGLAMSRRMATGSDVLHKLLNPPTIAPRA